MQADRPESGVVAEVSAAPGFRCAASGLLVLSSCHWNFYVAGAVVCILWIDLKAVFPHHAASLLGSHHVVETAQSARVVAVAEKRRRTRQNRETSPPAAKAGNES